MMHWQKFGALMLGASLLVATGCVHSRVQRLGRARLGHGGEGQVEVLTAVNPNRFEATARITVEATGVTDESRRTRHLLRRASLLGCDAITAIAHHADATSVGTCLVRRGPELAQASRPVKVARPSGVLRQKAAASGAVGVALLRVLDRAEQSSGEARAWPLRWYLDTYPNSPFRADVEALFTEAAAGGTTTSALR